MTNSIRLLTALALAASAFGAAPASADLSPWEFFCLVNSEPGEDTARCLDGLPPKSDTYVGGIQTMTIKK